MDAEIHAAPPRSTPRSSCSCASREPDRSSPDRRRCDGGSWTDAGTTCTTVSSQAPSTATCPSSPHPVHHPGHLLPCLHAVERRHPEPCHLLQALARQVRPPRIPEQDQ